MRLLLIFLLWSVVGASANADSAAELAAARASFDSVQAGLTEKANRLDGELRAAIWTQYYLALERLRQMEVHQQMMTKHQMDRAAQFGQARDEFNRAVDELKRLLPDSPASE